MGARAFALCEGRSVDDAPTTRAPDEYERRYMDADRALVIARVRQLLWLRLAFAAAIAVLVVVNVQQLMIIVPRLWELRHVAPLAVAAFFAVYIPLWLLPVLWFPVAELIGAVTRVVLTPTHLRVHRGFRTTDVPLEAVTGVAVEQTRRWFPSRLSWRDAVYQSFRTKDSLRVEWTDAKGRPRRLWVYLDEAEALRERVERARGGDTRVRIDVEAEADEEAATEEEWAEARETSGRRREG